MPPDNTILDNCGCDKILQAQYDFDNGNYPAGVTINNVEEMLQYNEGFFLQDIDQMICACNAAHSDPAWAPGASWSSEQITAIEANHIVVPMELACESCIDCSVMDVQLADFGTRFPGFLATDQNYETIFTNYMNDAFGFTLFYSDYDNFITSCHSSSEAPDCKLTQQAYDFAKFIDLVARRGELLTPSSSPISLLSNNVVFAQSLAGQAAIEAGQTATYYSNCSGVPCDPGNTLTVTYDINSTPCSATLIIPTGLGFGFKDIIGFKDLSAIGVSCTENDSFYIDAYYLSCGQISLATIKGVSDCFQAQICNCGDNSQLCNRTGPDDAVTFTGECYNPELNDIIYNATQAYNQAVAVEKEVFYAAYNGKCAQAFDDEQEDYVAAFNLYQLTLFYYDQAGNLVKTIPPEGIDRTFLDGVTAPIHTSADVATARTNGTPALVPKHAIITDLNHYRTNYNYNSYNQLVNTTNPDQDGISHYWYDFYGRIVASQNPLQASSGLYSYIFYDAKGRPIETGQAAPSTAITESLIKQDDLGVAFSGWITSVTRTEVNKTAYDVPYDITIPTKFSNGLQENLHLRVASVVYFDSYSTSTSALSYTSATHYSYDEHGNVKEVLQDFPDLAPLNLDLKRTNYDYDLISGNVNKVTYQAEQIDEMVHDYHYDEMNRLRDVWTSTDGFHKHRDAHYRYYDYGPLSRKEIGNDKVQGQDFAYTINGWLKAMNSNTLDRDRDQGKDGVNYALAPNLNVHRLVAKDIVGFTLGYFENDYSAIGTSSFEATYASSTFNTAGANLYNGNIRHLVNAISDLPIQGNAYHYDQLNRIKSMDVYRNTNLVADNNWTTGAYTDDYHTDFSYDRNGNLLSLNRNAYGTELDMDRFAYNYITVGTITPHLSNQLGNVHDTGTDYSSYDDIKQAMPAANYAYDAIGQLTTDPSEGIDVISWRYGDHKVSQITRSDADSPELHFIYDPFGRRIVKVEKTRSGGALLPNTDWKYTYYTYDAGGQVMATYNGNFQASSHQVHLAEQDIYGSGRLGMIDRGIEIFNTTPVSYTYRQANLEHHDSKGIRRFELTNHLGNVLGVINDRKTPVNEQDNVLNLDEVQYIDGGSGNRGITTEVTVEAWIKTTQTTTSNALVISKIATNDHMYNLYILTTGKAEIGGRNGAGSSRYSGASTTTVNDGQWHHLAGVINGDTWEIYVDGVKENSWTGTNASPNYNPSGDFYIGSGNIAYLGNQGYQGEIREVRWWKTARTPSEIASGLYTTLSGTETDLVGYWPLNEGSGVNVNDDVLTTTNTVSSGYANWDADVNTPFYYYEPVVLSYSDYYAFGMQMPGRTSNAGNYRYGFNGMEKDGELSGEGNSYTTQFRQYDPRLGRWKSIDPLMFEFPWMSPYVAFNDNPVYYIDPLGLKGKKTGRGKNHIAKHKGQKSKNDTPGGEVMPGPGVGDGPKGEAAPNGGVKNGDGSISGGKMVCHGCGENGEDTWFEPGQEPSTQSGQITERSEINQSHYWQSNFYLASIAMKGSADALYNAELFGFPDALGGNNVDNYSNVNEKRAYLEGRIAGAAALAVIATDQAGASAGFAFATSETLVIGAGALLFAAERMTVAAIATADVIKATAELTHLNQMNEARGSSGGGNAAKGRSVGAVPKGSSTVLQSGGHTLNKSTLKALGLTKGQGKIAIEALKNDLRLPANFHGKIMGNGDLVDPYTREVLGNLFDYLH